MANITIIGGGFSASIAKLLINKQCHLITPKNLDYLAMPRRKSLEVNKMFSIKAQSLGNLKFNLIKTKFHDRLICGGNSKIWGGFINLNELPKVVLKKLQAKKVFVNKLTFEHTGSISNKPDLRQMQDDSGLIYDASVFLDGAYDAYLESFFIDGFRIGLNLNFRGIKRTIFTDKLVLCVGAVQLLDLLYRSKFIDDGAKISFTEFSYKLRPKFTFYPTRFLDGSVVIRFHLARAICHFLGIQKKLSFLNFFKWFPLYLEQRFSHQLIQRTFELNDDFISERFEDQNSLKFGESIHYCNMRVNGESINHFISRMCPNIIGLGMPFVNQAQPGPISNDIINDAFLKLKYISK